MTLRLPWWLRWQRVSLQCRSPGFNPWVRKTPWRRAQQPTPVFLPGEFHEQKSLAGYSPRGLERVRHISVINNNSNSLIKEQMLALVGFSLKARLTCSCGKKRELVNQFGLKENETHSNSVFLFFQFGLQEYLHFHTILKFMCCSISFCKAK